MADGVSETVVCELCPRGCELAPGARGSCRIRVNQGGRLIATTYGFPCSIHVDPVEKKPLFHFLPGSGALSIATAGCTLHCLNCQNWEISQSNPEDVPAMALPPDELPGLAQRSGCASIAYTYTDPAAYFEYALDGCRAARAAGVKNLLVTAAYLKPAPMRELCRAADAANIDLKFMSDELYRRVCDGALKPVLDALVIARETGLELEITNLVIPTLNDRDEDFVAVARWVRDHLGAETPLHFSGFYPQHRLQHLPPTPADTLIRARDAARAEALRFVYVGNVAVPGGEDTLCPGCGRTLIRRQGFRVLENRLRVGACPDCAAAVKGVWT